MNVLDGENVKSIYDSLQRIIGVSQQNLDSFIGTFDIDGFYDDNPDYPHTGDELMVEMINTTFKRNIHIDVTYWFHLTRTFPSNKFEQGILPLNEGIDSIWTSLFDLVKRCFSGENWDKFRALFESKWGKIPGDIYKFRLNEGGGPYAVLIKEVAFKTEFHAFLEGPEFVENICSAFKEIHGYDLLKIYREHTKPCIVKFKEDGGKPIYVGAALMYLYSSLHGRKITTSSNSCFVGKGIKVPYENILKVEFFD